MQERRFATTAKVADMILVHKDDPNAHHTPPAGGEAFPVGSVFLSVVATNPNTLLGYGTWAQVASGQFLVGQDNVDTDFDTPEETGGAKSHTHTAHATADNLRTGGGVSGFATPGDAVHVEANHLPPYFVIFCWRRDA